jgi:hypothetical protein
MTSDFTQFALCLLIAFLPITYVSNFLHEAGHAVAGRAAGFVITSFGLGVARPFLVVPCGRARVYLARSRPLQGFAFTFMPQLLASRAQIALSLAGGIVANGLVALAGLGLWWVLSRGGPLWLAVAVWNGLYFVGNLLPFEARMGTASVRSDGLQILRVLRFGSTEVSPPETLQSLMALRDLWSSIGDCINLRLHLLAAAGAWVQLGDYELGRHLLEEAESVPGNVDPAVRGVQCLTRFGVAIAGSQGEEAALALDEAERIFRALGREAGQWMVARCRTISRIAREGSASGFADFDALLAHPIVRGHALLRANCLATRLQLTAALADQNDLERLISDYEYVRERCPSASRDRQVYWSLACHYARSGDGARTEAACREVAAAVSRIASEWREPAGREQFLRVQEPLAAEAREMLRRLGRDETAADFTGAPIPPDHSEADQRRRENCERDRRARHFGRRLMLFNTAVLSVQCCVLFGLGADAPGWLLFDVASFAFFSLIGIVCLTQDMLLQPIYERFADRCPLGGGAVVLVLACLPWICLVGVLFNASFIARS